MKSSPLLQMPSPHAVPQSCGHLAGPPSLASQTPLPQACQAQSSAQVCGLSPFSQILSPHALPQSCGQVSGDSPQS